MGAPKTLIDAFVGQRAARLNDLARRSKGMFRWPGPGLMDAPEVRNIFTSAMTAVGTSGERAVNWWSDGGKVRSPPS